MKTITLLASGTRGDIIPYIALGEGLQKTGHDVRIAAPIGFANLFQNREVTFVPFEGNPSDLLIEQGNSTPLTLGSSLIRSLQATQQFIRQVRPLYRNMLLTATQACRGSDLLIHGLPTLWGAHIAEGLQIPAIRALLQPLAITREFPSALLPFRFSFGGIGNRLSHWIVMQSIWLAWRSEINYARQTQFGLGRAHWLDASLRAEPHQPLTLNGYSEHIVPHPKDWNEKQVITGYWRTSKKEEYSNIDLENFIKTSPNPIAIGFGSPGTKGLHKILSALEEALNTANARAVLTLPAKWHSTIKSKIIFPVEYVPHEWLYPRVKVAVHHGGAGTTSASLHAGIPTIILPLAIDQFFWGEKIHKTGTGPAPIPQRKLTATKLAQAIQQSLQHTSMQAKAGNIRERLSREDGVSAAVNTIRKIFKAD